MVSVKETYKSGNRLIVVQTDIDEEEPTIYTPEEAREIKDQLEELV